MHQKIKVVLEVEGKYHQQHGNGILYKQKDLTIDRLALSGLIEAHATDWILQSVAYIKTKEANKGSTTSRLPVSTQSKRCPAQILQTGG